MKRILQDYLGRPVLEKPQPDVIGRPAVTRAVADVASFLDDARGGRADSNAQIVSEFAEFLAGPEASDARAPSAGIDPVFKERLRRRLWRLHLLIQPTTSHEPH